MATMADVAQHAGVTIQTVSNVLSGRVAVREKTRQKVLTAIEALNYRPNLLARGLRKGRTNVLAIVIPTIANPFYSEIVEEVERIADEEQYNLLLCTSQRSPERLHRQLQILADRSIDGLLLFSDHTIVQEVAMIKQWSFPVILCGLAQEPYPDHFPVVSVNFREAGYLAGQHLLDLGHREGIAVIYEENEQKPSVEGFCAALRHNGIQLAPHQMQSAAVSTLQEGYRATQELLKHLPTPRAIYATNDLMALGCLAALKKHGLQVPTDVSLIGCDNIELGMVAEPPLTTIAIPKRELAEEITRLLLRCIKEEVTPRLLTLLRPQLIVRQSTSSPSS